MTEEPWWAPIRKAIVKKVAEIIEEADLSREEKVVLTAQFEDVPPKAPKKRRKALPAHPEDNVHERTIKTEK